MCSFCLSDVLKYCLYLYFTNYSLFLDSIWIRSIQVQAYIGNLLICYVLAFGCCFTDYTRLIGTSASDTSSQVFILTWRCEQGHPSSYEARRRQCPAWGKICKKCDVRNHFGAVCRQKTGLINELTYASDVLNTSDSALSLIACIALDHFEAVDNDNIIEISVAVTPQFPLT